MEGFSNPGFSPSNKKSEKYVYYIEKGSDSIKKKGIKNICQKSYYYSYICDNDEFDHALEHFLSNLETKVSQVLKKIKILSNNYHNKSVDFLITNQDKIYLAGFILWSFKRTPYILKNLQRVLSDDFEYYIGSNSKLLNKERIDRDIKNYSLDAITQIGYDSEYDFIKIFFNKSWNIFKCHNDSNFITSDNPVILLHRNNSIEDPKSEIHIPLSSELLLVLTGNYSEQVSYIYLNDKKKIREENQFMLRNAYNIVLSKDYDLLNYLIRKSKFGKFNPSKVFKEYLPNKD